MLLQRKTPSKRAALHNCREGAIGLKLDTSAFRVYPFGRPFTIVTDHRSLEWLEQLKENIARLTRWSLALQPYNFILQH